MTEPDRNRKKGGCVREELCTAHGKCPGCLSGLRLHHNEHESHKRVSNISSRMAAVLMSDMYSACLTKIYLDHFVHFPQAVALNT